MKLLYLSWIVPCGKSCRVWHIFSWLVGWFCWGLIPKTAELFIYCKKYIFITVVIVVVKIILKTYSMMRLPIHYKPSKKGVHYHWIYGQPPLSTIMYSEQWTQEWCHRVYFEWGCTIDKKKIALTATTKRPVK